MTESNTDKSPKIWLISAICGVLAFLVLLSIAGYSTMASVIVGVLVMLLVAILLWIAWYEEPVAEQPAARASSPASTPSSSVAKVPEVESAETDVSEPAPASSEGASQEVSVTEEVAAAPVEEPVVAAESAETDAAPAPKRAPVAKDGTPDNLLTAPREGGADDLKMIKGVGPKMEATLNELGIYHFDQVAALRKKEREWLDDRLKFKGRIERDDWVGQAKKLARGEETEFSKRAKY